MAIIAKTRAQLALHATTRLHQKKTLDLVRVAVGAVRGGGTSLLTSGLQNIGAQVHVERASDSALALSITSGKRLIELCTFSAHVTNGSDGMTLLRVGGLEILPHLTTEDVRVHPGRPEVDRGIRRVQAIPEPRRGRVVEGGSAGDRLVADPQLEAAAMEAIGYVIGVVIAAGLVWASIAPYLVRRYPRDGSRPTDRGDQR